MILSNMCLTMLLVSLTTALQAFGNQEPRRLPDASAKAHLQRGLDLLRESNLERARNEFKAALGLSPRMVQAHVLLGIAENQLGNYNAAVPAFREALRLDANSEPAHYNLALALLRLHKTDEAIRELQQAVKLNARHAAAQYNLGLVLVQEDRFKEAAEHLEVARTLAPSDPAVVIHLARAYLGANRPREAIELLDGLKGGNSSWQISYFRGLAYAAADESEPAIENLREAARLKSNEPDVHYALGSLLLKSPDPEKQNEGRTEFDQALNLAPHEGKYYITLGRWLLDHYQLEPAVALLKRAVANLPATVDIYLMMGLAEAEFHGAVAAKPFVEKALELNPRSGPAHHLLGNLYLRVGDDENAAKYYKKAAELSPANDIYFSDFALALERLNKVEKAAAWAEKSTRLKPDRSFNHYLLGKLYAKLGRKTEAIRELETSVKLDPKFEYAYYLLARAYLQMGNQAQAEEWGRKLAELKETKDRLVGLAPPASDAPEILDLRESPEAPHSRRPQPSAKYH